MDRERKPNDGPYYVDVPFELEPSERKTVRHAYEYALEWWRDLPLGRVRRASELPFQPSMMESHAPEFLILHQVVNPDGEDLIYRPPTVRAGIILPPDPRSSLAVNWPKCKLGDVYAFEIEDIADEPQSGFIRLVGSVAGPYNPLGCPVA